MRTGTLVTLVVTLTSGPAMTALAQDDEAMTAPQGNDSQNLDEQQSLTTGSGDSTFWDNYWYQPPANSGGFQQPLAGSYQLEQPLAGSYQLQQPLNGTYQLQQPLNGTYQLQQPLNGTYQLQQPLNGTYQLQQPLNGTGATRAPRTR
ncbi:hypothetical protein [Corallococcus aberystwythensis]|uniref:Uncharacterized protein n=1 Tax=Corallococcus aberystwythensis TaxID=2316722 RepID=A0A3A8PRA0_9BACT|nr:hypothetical protein [Corallococcus aberystwythensis]RKH58548.1 hypothetical protein D7W81_28880 [Corallococcus aberystwythensis]